MKVNICHEIYVFISVDIKHICEFLVTRGMNTEANGSDCKTKTSMTL